jgi:hypothetical protein
MKRAVTVLVMTLLVVSVLSGMPLALHLLKASATPPETPVTIETLIHFEKPPFFGTFEVLEGHDILGCSKGTFVDTPMGSIEKEFTCSAGPGDGNSFNVLFEPWVGFVSGGEVGGYWRVVEGSGFFARLQGQGEFSVEGIDLDGDGHADHGIEVLTGEVHFDP